MNVAFINFDFNMKIVLKILFILACFLPCSLTYAQDDEEEEFLTGQELLQGCEEGSAPGSPNQYCMQYVFGYVQTVVALQGADPSQPQLFGINPEQIGLQEVTENVTNWLRSKPERLNEEAYILVGQSLATYYPCQNSAF